MLRGLPQQDLAQSQAESGIGHRNGEGTDGGDQFPPGREGLTGLLEIRPYQGRGVAEDRVTWSALRGARCMGTSACKRLAQRRGFSTLPKELAVTRGGVRAVSTVKLRLSRCREPSG